MLVDESQNAFIPSRQISDNVLLTQELMRNYHRNRGPSKVAFKIDIHKAYDSVEWDFMKQCLIHFGFHKKMIDWVMNCLSSPSFSINVNGYSHGFFKGMRGLRQGDPLSPYLFTLVMEVFSLMVKRKIEDDGGFKYHWRCDRLNKALIEFSGVSGLVLFLDRALLFWYLGLPLLSSRLFKHHCGGLIDNVKKRLINWKNKALSFAGRLQLIKSVVSSIQVYWASTFILPKAVNAEIEQLMRGFLWSHGELRRGHAKVKWKDVCSMKNQGGLGIKSLNIWNISLIAKHIWNVVSKKDSLWVKWVNAYRLIDRSSNVRNFWDIPVLNDSSWGWRKLLQCRDVLREHFVCRIGDGSQTSVWYDNWLSLGPLSQFISNREIYEAGFSLECKVCEVVFNGEWLWPEGWRGKFPFLFHLPPPILFKDRRDRVLWRSNDGKVGNFSVSAVWFDLSEVKPKVPWYKLVWFSQNIPRHAFMLWLAINQKLKTQDRLEVWQEVNDIKCSLCGVEPESHDHLFFDCCFSLEIWHQFRDLVKLDSAPNALSVLVPYIAGRPINRSIWSILQRLVIGTLVYFIWQERNLRRFQMKSRSVKDLCMIIKDVVRFRLLSLKIRSSKQVMEAAELWNLGVEDGNGGRKFGFCMNGSSDQEDSPVYDRFENVKGMHAVPPPMTGNYMPPKSDFGIDESQFTYGLKQTKTSEFDYKTSDFDSCESNTSVETLESVPKPVVNKPKVVSEPRIWSDTPIIEEYELDSDEEYMFKALVEQEKPSCASANIANIINTVDLSHLIRDCDFHEKRMAKHVELNKRNDMGTGQRETRPVWNNVQRLNHKNKFVPTAVLTRTGRFPINIASQVNTAGPRMNRSKRHYWSKVSKYNSGSMTSKLMIKALKDKGIVDKVVKVLALQKDKDAQAEEILKLKHKIKKLEKKWRQGVVEEKDTVKKDDSTVVPNVGTAILEDSTSSIPVSIAGVTVSAAEPTTIIHILMLEDGTEFYMLAERKYLLAKKTLKRLLALRLIVESESEAVFDLLRFIQKQIDESRSHDGTLAIPEQTTTGKETSNPFMAGSLPKPIHFCDSLQYDEDSFYT
ncbi:putative RNA-directed DNA polymerase [Tanacetum coccineum]